MGEDMYDEAYFNRVYLDKSYTFIAGERLVEQTEDAIRT